MHAYTAKELLSPRNSHLFQEIVALLTYSFTEDPLHRWLFSGHSEKDYLVALPIYMRSLLHLALLADASVLVITGEESKPLVIETKDENNGNDQQPTQRPIEESTKIRACSITIPPHGNAAFDSNITAIRAGALAWPFQLGIGPTYRLITQFVPELHKLYARVFPDPSTTYHNYHLLYLATHPASQGQGLGKQLLREIHGLVQRVNDDAAREAKVRGTTAVPCPLYLEASSNDSKRLYERVGYEHKATMTYGEVDGGQDFKSTEDGVMVGGKEFGMVWYPKPSPDI